MGSRRYLTLLAALALPLGATHAQLATGSITAAATGRPIAGAIVSLLTARDDTLATALSREDGRFSLTRPNRREATLLIRAIGFQPLRITLATAGDTTIAAQMSAVAFTLSAVNVNAFSSCARSQTGTADILAAWVEVTTALENSRMVRDDKSYVVDYVLYQTLTDSRTGRVRLLRNDTASWVATRPFKVTPPRELASRGYVVESSQLRNAGSPVLNYRAPDEMVLLDKSFQNAHCFWASAGEDENAGLIGVFFIPITGVQINDIRGVFWLDAATYELKRLEFVYTRVALRANRSASAADELPQDIRADQTTPSLSNPVPGGILEFTRLSDGSFVVSSWRIFVNDTWNRILTAAAGSNSPVLFQETGGMVLRMSPAGRGRGGR
jgi:hypothetical protein